MIVGAMKDETIIGMCVYLQLIKKRQGLGGE
jgi:hypothetical protein